MLGEGMAPLGPLQVTLYHIRLGTCPCPCHTLAWVPVPSPLRMGKLRHKAVTFWVASPGLPSSDLCLPRVPRCPPWALAVTKQGGHQTEAVLTMAAELGWRQGGWTQPGAWGALGRADRATWEHVLTQIVQMSNYCGIGIDAELSLDFHQAREEEPGKFTSRCEKSKNRSLGLL